MFRNLSLCNACVALAAVASLSVAQTAAEWDSPRVNAIAQKLRCPCGCQLPMSCQMPPHPCPTCKKNRVRISNMLAEGMSEQQIVERYVNEQGAAVLWVTPGLAGQSASYAVLLGGCGVVLLVLRRICRRAPTPEPQLDLTTAERLKNELKEFEE